MKFAFSDSRLEVEARRLISVVTRLVWLIAAVFALAVTAGFLLELMQEAQQDLATDIGRIQGEAEIVASRAPGALASLKEDIGKVLADTLRYDLLDARQHDHFTVYDRSDQIVAEAGEMPSWPSLRIERPLRVAGKTVGSVIAERSILDVCYKTTFMGLLMVAMGMGVWFALRAIPVKALLRTMDRLDREQMARSKVEGDLREHVLGLEVAQQALQESTARLQTALEAAAESNQAKSQFLASMSHELRTPLNAIIGFAEIMDQELFGRVGNERYREYVELILGSGRHLLSLVNEILDLSKASSGRLELYDGEVDIALLVRDLIRTMQATASRAGVTLSSTVPPNLPHARVDPQRMTQILLNLVSNAVKFNTANGEVRIEASCEPANGMWITVSDTGIGIAPENIPKALERFGQVEDTTTRRFEGSGLGLPISKKLVELHGGTLTLKSALGKGTSVTIWLPPERVMAAPPAGRVAALRDEPQLIR